MKATYTADGLRTLTTGNEYEVLEKQEEYSYILDDTNQPLIVLNSDLENKQ